MQPPSSQVFLCWENWYLYCFLIILDFADMWGESRSLSQMPFFWFLRGMEPCQAVGGLGPSKIISHWSPTSLTAQIWVYIILLGMTADHCRSWEKRHIPDSPDFSLTIQSNHRYLQFWVFICQKNLEQSGGIHHSPGFYPESFSNKIVILPATAVLEPDLEIRRGGLVIQTLK